MQLGFFTRLSCKATVFACALLNLCPTCHAAATTIAVTDSVIPFNQGGLFLGGTNNNVVAVSWTQTSSVSNATICALVQSSDPAFQTGKAWLTNAIGPGATPSNNVVPPVNFTAPIPKQSHPIPLTLLFTGVNLAPGTYY